MNKVLLIFGILLSFHVNAATQKQYSSTTGWGTCQDQGQGATATDVIVANHLRWANTEKGSSYEVPSYSTGSVQFEMSQHSPSIIPQIKESLISILQVNEGERIQFPFANFNGGFVSESSENQDQTVYDVDLSNLAMPMSSFESGFYIFSNFNNTYLAYSTLYSSSFDNSSFVGASLYSATIDGSVLSGADLTGAQLVSANISNSDILNAKLNNANFDQSVISGAKFSGSNLTGANFNSATLENVLFYGQAPFSSYSRISTLPAREVVSRGFGGGGHGGGGGNKSSTLINATFNGSGYDLPTTLNSVTFDNCNLTGAQFQYAFLNNVSFRNANLSDVTGSFMTLDNVDLGSVRMQNVTLSDVDILGGTFSNSILSGTLTSINIQNTDLVSSGLSITASGGQWVNTTFDRSTITGSINNIELQGTSMNDASIENMIMTGVTFTESSIYNSYVYNTSFISTNFVGADLSYTTFDEVTFSLVNLSESNLKSSNLASVQGLETANLQNAKYDQNTIFPSSFGSPQSHGMIYEETVE